MTKSIQRTDASPLARIEPEHRLVVLARTLQARDPGMDTALQKAALDWARLGDMCLGQAVYRHHAVFRNASDAPEWSHLELTYFRNVVPAHAILDFGPTQHPSEAVLLRAEILLTTPSAFVLPRDWQGSADRPERKASLEYIDVQSASLGQYRDVMRKYIGPAAAKLVRAKRIGTFRAMETAAVLYRQPGLTIDWNQIHLCEVDAKGFAGFGPLFAAALQEESRDSALAGVFAGLERIRTIPRWTLNDPVVEADAALGREGTLEP
jgi:hypothetical protein